MDTFEGKLAELTQRYDSPEGKLEVQSLISNLGQVLIDLVSKQADTLPNDEYLTMTSEFFRDSWKSGHYVLFGRPEDEPIFDGVVPSSADTRTLYVVTMTQDADIFFSGSNLDNVV